MTARRGTSGLKGFDCNCPVTALHAVAMKAAGFAFALRYLPRGLVRGANDLTAEELGLLHAAGLAVMPVQHVESETSWTPTSAKGTTYGGNASSLSMQMGLAPRTTVWLDLEGVDPETKSAVIVAYCNAWAKEVRQASFEPGLYVGWRAGLDAHTLYNALTFTRYWAAYNLNRDEYPAVRGVCMRQRVPRPGEVPDGCRDLSHDVNLIQADDLGGFPNLDMPRDV